MRPTAHIAAMGRKVNEISRPRKRFFFRLAVKRLARAFGDSVTKNINFVIFVEIPLTRGGGRSVCYPVWDTHSRSGSVNVRSTHPRRFPLAPSKHVSPVLRQRLAGFRPPSSSPILLIFAGVALLDRNELVPMGAFPVVDAIVRHGRPLPARGGGDIAA